MSARPWEITDLLWSHDPSGEPSGTPVVVTEAAERLRQRGQHRAARLVERLPSRDGLLDPDEMDRLGLRVHCELQRLGEELQMGRRVEAMLRPLVATLHHATGQPVQIVDVGCGLGFVLRWLAAYGELGAPVELIGVDFNAALIRRARQLAAVEALDCRFLVGDALRAEPVLQAGERTVLISTGMLHHLSPAELATFFAAHQRSGIAAFAHWDIVPSRWATLGAWVFHRARMREPVSRHDGVMSVRRAYPTNRLLDLARSAAPDYAISAGGSRLGALDVLRPIRGERR